MKRSNTILTIVLLIAAIFSSNLALADQPIVNSDNLVKATERITFSENILSALKSENVGLQVSAMQQVVKYKDLVDINKSALALVRVYRNSYDEKMRMLALVTIHSIQNDWALGILKRDLEFEYSPTIKNLMIAVLNNDIETFKKSEEITAFLH
jgi:hypothetical protein